MAPGQPSGAQGPPCKRPLDVCPFVTAVWRSGRPDTGYWTGSPNSDAWCGGVGGVGTEQAQLRGAGAALAALRAGVRSSLGACVLFVGGQCC